MLQDCKCFMFNESTKEQRTSKTRGRSKDYCTKEPRLKGTWYCKERMKFRVGGSHGIEKLGCRDRQSHIMYNLIFIPTAMKINQNILSRGVLWSKQCLKCYSGKNFKNRVEGRHEQSWNQSEGCCSSPSNWRWKRGLQWWQWREKYIHLRCF